MLFNMNCVDLYLKLITNRLKYDSLVIFDIPDCLILVAPMSFSKLSLRKRSFKGNLRVPRVKNRRINFFQSREAQKIVG